MLSRDQAIRLSETRFWEQYTALEVVQFQLFEDRLCLPYNIYMNCLQTVFGRTFSDQELKDIESLRYEFCQKFFTGVKHHFPPPSSQAQ